MPHRILQLAKHKKVKGGFWVTLGFLLSPLSWWNDLLINIPLAYGFAYVFSLFNKALFPFFMVLGYWLTNILGFVLMNKGLVKFVDKKDAKYDKKAFAKDLLLSVLYSLLIIVLIKFDLIRLPAEYFGQ